MLDARVLEDVWRRESAHVLAALLRRHGDLADCEDAAQEAALAASVQWERDGLPQNPRAWLIRVASRRLVDTVRSGRAREEREATHTDRMDMPANADGDARRTDADDTLRLLVVCCHPALSRASQVALTLRSVAGLSASQIAAAYLVPERTMAQRLSRARATLRAAGARFELPPPAEAASRLAAALDVCHLMFNEGYVRSSGEHLLDADLAGEAIRLTRQLHRAVPEHDEVSGALALMLLTHARAPARTTPTGDLVPLAEQDRRTWDATQIAEGVGLLEEVLPRGHVGRFQLQAAIAAVHAESPTWEETDWAQISVLYAMLDAVAPSPAVTLNRAVAVGMAVGPAEGLALVDDLLTDPAMQRHHRTHAVRAHLLESAGELAGARAAYERAAALTASLPEQRYLNRRAARLPRS
ncbi:sigma-70 family RNA polymerase sigma factor [Mumia sp. zg.B53]|uniref:RNA polymerase sigma factor n=1 Tax=Mumia sp. zg.B53 TaxID=2855449 RepID=UPI0027E267DC|nr:sigma-70 family RNA polymerase sigma factor [Mumia sp. zg.B53]